MKQKSTLINLSLTLIILSISQFTMTQNFVHPGILHTQSDFERMAEKVNAAEQPFTESYNYLVNSSEAQLSWNALPQETIIRGGTGDNVVRLYRDVHAAYQHALLYKVTGNTAHGDKARDILNAWSATHTLLTGNADRYLASGLFGYQFANAAEIMRGYSGFEVTRFQTYLLDVYYYPLVERFLIGNDWGADHNDACISNYWANWDLANMAAMIAIGVFCDNRDIYNKGIEYFKNGAGNGSIGNAIPFVHSSTLAQWQESGRDQGHTILGIGLMSSVCEIAWNQGDDLYAYDDYRFRKACEYVAQYNMGHEVPFTNYVWYNGSNCTRQEQTIISAAGRGELRPVWEMIYNHYANRVGQGNLIPFVAEEAAQHRPEAGPGGHATTYDQPGFGSLTHFGDYDSSSGEIPSGGISWEAFNFTNYFIRHKNNVSRIDTDVAPIDDKQWNMVSGLADASGVSFESVNFPGQYLRHFNYDLILGNVSNAIQEEDATFYKRSGLANNELVSFESYNFPGYYIRHSNYVLRIEEIINSIDEQDATFKQIGVAGINSGSTYTITVRENGKTLDVYAEDNNVLAYDYWGGANQHFEVNSVADGYYHISPVSNPEHSLDVANQSTANGANIGTYSYWGGANQEWEIIDLGTGYYSIINRNSGLSLDVDMITDNVIQYAYWGGNNQQFEFVNSSLKYGKLKHNTTTNNYESVEVMLYPNPAVAILNLIIPDELVDRANLIICNAAGQMVYNRTDINSTTESINISGLSKGVYSIVISNTKQSVTKKFVIE